MQWRGLDDFLKQILGVLAFIFLKQDLGKVWE